MNRSLRWKLILAFLLVFLAGGASGFFAAFFLRPPLFGPPHHRALAERMKQHLRAELRLRPQQMEQISPIIDRANSQLQSEREATAHRVHNVFEQAHREMLPLLDPEQQTRLQRMEQRHRQMLHRHGWGPPEPPPSP